jgi:hypothetical protein
MTRQFLCIALAAGALLAAGCSPAIMGNTTRPGAPPKSLIGVNRATEMWKGSKANVVSKDENLQVTVTTEKGENCVANLKFKEALKGMWYGHFIPGFEEEATLVYDGTWGNDMPSSCLEFIQAPGGTFVQARIGEFHTSMIGGDGRSLTLISKAQPSDILPKSSFSYLMPRVKGVDE